MENNKYGTDKFQLQLRAMEVKYRMLQEHIMGTIPVSEGILEEVTFEQSSGR